MAVSRAGIRLAFVAALQYLSARQRAVLILRDVLEWPAAEVADLLGTTTTAVNSGLRRARAQLARATARRRRDCRARRAGPAGAAGPVRRGGRERRRAARWPRCCAQDVALEMPPLLTWFTGRQAVVRFVAANLLTAPGRLRLLPVMANGQPRSPSTSASRRRGICAHAMLVLTVTATGIARIVAFQSPGLFASFGLPPEYSAAAGPAPARTGGPAVAPLSRGLELLESAVGYALAGAALGTPQLLSRPTPCAGWDLEMLLDHVSDSIGVLHEAIAAGRRQRQRQRRRLTRRPGPDPVARLRGQAARLLGACAAAGPAERLVAIGDRELTASMVAVTGAIEITVHGWDIAVACGAPRPVPPGLATVLLPIAPLLIPPGTRPGLFADPVRLPGPACPGDQLVAFLGRQPRPLAAPGSGAPEPGARRAGRPAAIPRIRLVYISRPPDKRRGTRKNTAELE